VCSRCFSLHIKAKKINIILPCVGDNGRKKPSRALRFYFILMMDNSVSFVINAELRNLYLLYTHRRICASIHRYTVSVQNIIALCDLLISEVVCMALYIIYTNIL